MSLIKRNTKQNRAREEITGPKKVSAYSYHNSRNELQETTGRDPKRSVLSENKLSKILNRVGATIFLVVCAICLFSILSLSTVPHIILVSNQGGDSLFNQYEPSLMTTSQKLFASSIFNHNKITVNSNGITDKLASEFPEFSQITITMPLIGQHPLIYVTQATPAVVLTNPTGEYLLSQDGIALLKGPSSAYNGLKLPIVNDLSGLDISIGQAALTSQDISFIQTINYQLLVKHYLVTSYSLPAGSSELDAQIASQAYIVKFNLESNNPTTQAGRFMATANYLKQNNIQPSSYVDVRTDGRVYYK